MKTTEQIGALAAALAKAQGELKNIEKGKINTHFKTKYADIADGLDVVRPVLSKHGIAIIQATDMNPDTGIFWLTTRLVHTSGEWVESIYPLPVGKAQEQGSAITYARRYSLFSMVGVAGTNEDDDGNAANTAPASPAKAPPKPKVNNVNKETLLTEAKQVAAEGTDALREWWTGLPQAERASLTQEEIADLKNAAAQASAGDAE
jgi:hypothetical protein